MSKLSFARKLLPTGYQIVSEQAIDWLFRTHRNVYDGFYERSDMDHHSREKQVQEGRSAIARADQLIHTNDPPLSKYIDCEDCQGTGIGYNHEPGNCGPCGGRGYNVNPHYLCPDH